MIYGKDVVKPATIAEELEEGRYPHTVKECEIYRLEVEGMTVKLSFIASDGGLHYDCAVFGEFGDMMVSGLEPDSMRFLGLVAAEIDRIEKG